MVKSGGRLIYATCSLLRDENEQIAEAFLAENNEFSLVPAHEILKVQNVPLNTGDYLKLSPHVHQTDGFFAAVFVKKAAVNSEKVLLDTLATNELAAEHEKELSSETVTKPKTKRVINPKSKSE